MRGPIPSRVTAIFGFLLLALPSSLAAQVEANPELRGTVERAGVPLPDAEVVLHRVDAMDAGQIDTTFTGPDGGFLLSLPTVPDPGGRGEVYFASVEHQGVLYFGPPVGTAAELDSIYRIRVWDTIPAPPGGANLPVTVRYLLVEPAPEGWNVTDLIQLRVDGEFTLVPSEDGVTWRYPLPPGVLNVQVGGGDIAPVSTTIGPDTVGVTMPLSPGERQMVLRYQIDSLDLTLPLPGTTEELEVLVREPAPEMEATGLVAVEPIQMEEGVTYRRYAALALTDSSVALVAVPTSGMAFRVEWLMIALALVLAAAGIWAVSRRPAGTETTGDGDGVLRGGGALMREEPFGTSTATLPGDERDRILLRIARLDERIEEMEESPERAELRGERGRLKARLGGDSGD